MELRPIVYLCALGLLASCGQGGQGQRPTAIVAANDHLALQVIDELQDQGIAVGSAPDSSSGSIAVTGFDDLPFAAYVQTPLTTVRQPIAAIADILLDLLVSIIDKRAGSKRRMSPTAHTTTPQQGGQPDARGSEKANVPVKWIGPMQALVEPELMVRTSA